jgi:hypothetical protein
MHMAAFSARTYLLSLFPPYPPLLTPPFKCDNRGSQPAISFPPPPLATPPQEDYGQILATSPKLEDGPHLGVCEYGS